MAYKGGGAKYERNPAGFLKRIVVSAVMIRTMERGTGAGMRGGEGR